MSRQLFASIVFAAALVLAGDLPGRAQAGRPFTNNFTPAEFAARRAKIYDAIGPEAVAIMQGLPAVHSSALFRQSNEFFYASGVAVPQALLVMDGGSRRSTLYLPRQNQQRAAAEGELLSSDDPAATIRITGVDDVRSTDRLEADLKAFTAARKLYVPYAPTEGDSESPDGARRRTTDAANDPWDGRISREMHFRELLKARVPHLEQHDLSPLLNNLRATKSPAELALIERATRIGGEALLEAMRSTTPGIAEHELDAVARLIFDIFVRHGAQGEAYRAIVASGPSAMNAHHRASAKIMTDGELVLMDYCPDLGYYRCDVTRQWPVNGKFSPAQRELYVFYLAVYEAVLHAIKPNITAQAVLQDALNTMERVLAETKFSKPLYQQAASQFVQRYRNQAANERPNLGHAVGMATHDFGGGAGLLAPGLVFTIEPEFRIPEEQIFIRLEDMIAITDSGARILSDFVPRSIDAVEKIIALPGLLQQYGKIR